MSAITDAPVKIVAALHPLKTERADFTVPHGMTISEIFETIQTDPALRRHAHVYIGPYYIPREKWSVVRPNADTLVTVRAFIPPQGGASGKDILRSVLLIAVTAAALFVPGALGLTGLLATGVQVAIGLGGALLINALIPPRTDTNPSGVEDSATKFIEGARNTANPFGVVPVLFGKHRVMPLLAADPITEIVGDDQYLRMLFCWGIGPITLSDIKIGETAITEFDDVQIEHRYGYDADTPVTLYGSTVDQENFQITLSEPDGFTTRTTSNDADEIGVDFIFPSGLIEIADDGTRSNASVVIQIEYSETGAGVWNNIPVADGTTTFPAAWTNASGGTFDTITFTHKRTNAIRHGLTWKVPTRGQYDVRVKRVTLDTASEQIRDVILWATLRTITDEHPIQSPVPVALTALRIKATDQLSGVIDEFNGVPERVALDWNGAAWVEQATRNPASMFRFALQNDGLQSPYPDASIDLEMLEYWHEYCDDHGFKFDQHRDFSSTLLDLLTDIAAAGRASPQNVDGKWTVVIDEAKSPVSHVTPRNSRDFKASKAFVDLPHGFRVQFNNEEQGYRNDELRVYLPGYTDDTATKFETIEFPGVTVPTLIAKHARFMALVGVQRPEQWSFVQDMERLVYRRGDVILITHDVLLVGLAYGRIKSVVLDGSNNCTGVTVDEALPMDGFSSYGMSIRTVDNIAVTAQVVTVEGDQTTVTFVSPIAAASAPEAGDLFGFGILGSETDKALVLSVEPNSGFDALITCCPYRAQVYTDDAASIPEFITGLTPIEAVPNVEVLQVRSDETVLTVGAGESLSVHVNVKVQPITDTTAYLETQIRPSTTTEPFAQAQVDAQVGNEISIGDVRTGEYVDIRLRWVVPGRLVPGAWSVISAHRVVGKSNAPAALQNMTLSTFGGQAYIRWDKPNELDVQFGGEVRFRHSADPAPEWTNSVSIGEVARAKDLIASLPLKPGTYLARVFDDAGNQSTVVTVDTKQANVLQFGPVDDIDEAPTFAGTHLDTTVNGDDHLTLAATGMWDDIPDIDAEPDIDAYTGEGSSLEGTYTFANGFDFLTVKRVRLTTRVQAFNAAIFDNIDDWSFNIDDRPDFDGVDAASCDCKVYVRQTDDDPAGSPTWSEWERLDSMEVECRGCQFKAVLTSTNTDFSIFVTELGVDAEEII